jgi:hypothetical protein
MLLKIGTYLYVLEYACEWIYVIYVIYVEYVYVRRVRVRGVCTILTMYPNNTSYQQY